MKKQTELAITVVLLCLSINGICQNSNIQKTSVPLNETEIILLKKELGLSEKYYDDDKKMIWSVTKEKHYHSDLDSGIKVFNTRSSIQYAAGLMHTKDASSMQRSISIIKAILPLQEKDPAQPFCGIWPYYPEDPLRGRKAPVDYNWADFMSVYLIDIVRTAPDQLDSELKAQIKDALVLASHAIMKRDLKADYTNMCIMGSYVCYMVGNMYDLPQIAGYGKNKLLYFYNYTKNNKGFTEYNSPTYTVVAMNELLRMKLAINNPADKKMVDELYGMCWSMIVRHFHQPSAQWCGPNLRAYNDLLTPELKQLLYYSSKGKIDLPGEYPREAHVLEPHEIPATMVAGFLQQQLPHIEIDTFTVGKYQLKSRVAYANGELAAKDIIGKLYLHFQYAFASVNTSYLWNQTRPLMAHWGSPEKPSYLRLRFLHDNYDFSSVHIKSVQDSSDVLSILNLAYNGGDRHPTIDPIRDSTISATDLRLRLETGGDIASSVFTIINKNKNELLFESDSMRMIITVPYNNWGDLKGHWEISASGDKKYADFVIYASDKKSFNIAAMNEAVIGLSITTQTGKTQKKPGKVTVKTDSKYLRLSRKGLTVAALKKPNDEFRIKNDFEIQSK